MAARNNQDVHRLPWLNVLEGNRERSLGNYGRWNRASYYFAKNAVDQMFLR
jgi:hypothetical protein